MSFSVISVHTITHSYFFCGHHSRLICYGISAFCLYTQKINGKSKRQLELVPTYAIKEFNIEIKAILH